MKDFPKVEKIEEIENPICIQKKFEKDYEFYALCFPWKIC